MSAEDGRVPYSSWGVPVAPPFVLAVGSLCFTISTGRTAVAATAPAILPSMSRFHPVKPREPMTMASHCFVAAVSRIVRTIEFIPIKPSVAKA